MPTKAWPFPKVRQMPGMETPRECADRLRRMGFSLVETHYYMFGKLPPKDKHILPDYDVDAPNYSKTDDLDD
jgi:hypothetical protein